MVFPQGKDSSQSGVLWPGLHSMIPFHDSMDLSSQPRRARICLEVMNVMDRMSFTAPESFGFCAVRGGQAQRNKEQAFENQAEEWGLYFTGQLYQVRHGFGHEDWRAK